MSEETKDQTLEELELLKLQNMRLHVSSLDGRLEATKQRHQALSVEMQILPEKLQQIQKEREAKAQEFNNAYAAAKEKLEVPEGKEIDLETGSIVDAPPPPQQ